MWSEKLSSESGKCVLCIEIHFPDIQLNTSVAKW
jgi:hypothetical protein